MIWRFIDSGLCTPATNMAIDEAIMLELEKNPNHPVIRFYDWNPPTLSIGYNQEATKEADLDILSAKGYGFVRRPTGGRAVLHKHEVTYAVIATVQGILSGSVTQSYAVISEALSNGLHNLGIPAELEKGSVSSSSQRESANPCFSSTSRFELAVKGKKIVGSAQVRKNGILLQHGSILLNENQREMAEILPDLNEEKRKLLARYMERKTICVNQVSNRKITYEEVVAAITEGFRTVWESEIFNDLAEISVSEYNTALHLTESKYENDSWNLKK
ncbi:MAG: lipoate--protein ligase family protein [Candidatus Cloacimonetes bacterium]|nr:lipoate--protein ligase family protein [Candidatus Cloacimonadota bacterium]